ncbi:MAG TPA: UDP-N-acetylmuramate dehydrogenase [Anaerolineales bacterium]
MRMASGTRVEDFQSLKSVFGTRVEIDVPLARLTAARVGGPADALVSANSLGELVETVTNLWELQVPFVMLGGGSNILVSDAGVRGVVLLNRARQVRFDFHAHPPTIYAESGANLGLIARQAAARGLAGLEWAGGIPGTLGGAVVGNAGAHGGNLAGNLLLAEILHLEEVMDGHPSPNGTRSMRVLHERWPVKKMEYGYRTSVIKRSPGVKPQGSWPNGQPRMVVLSALLQVQTSTPEAVQSKMDEFVSYRRQTQPPGASMGSMFKNPPGDYAGQLIEAAGLKGTRIGNAEISPLHANFFINHGGASAGEIWSLIQLARSEVAAKFGVALELEIELVGTWETEGPG